MDFGNHCQTNRSCICTSGVGKWHHCSQTSLSTVSAPKSIHRTSVATACPQRQSEVQCDDATHGLPQQGCPASEAPVEETELVIELPRRYPIRSRGAPERFEQTIQTFRIIVTCKFFVFFLGNLGRRNVES